MVYVIKVTTHAHLEPILVFGLHDHNTGLQGFPSQAKILSCYIAKHMVTLYWIADRAKFLTSLPIMCHKWCLPCWITIRTLVQGSRIGVLLWIYLVAVKDTAGHGIKDIQNNAHAAQDGCIDLISNCHMAKLPQSVKKEMEEHLWRFTV